MKLDGVNGEDVLNHGYIRQVESWGKGDAGMPEAGIVEAARQSTQGAFRSWAPYLSCERCGAWMLGADSDPARTLWQSGGDAGCEHKWKKYPKGDDGLLSFLFNSRPQHATPFEFAGMVIEVQAPIFVFREWHRHRTQSYNEMSARYAPLPPFDYVPSLERSLLGGQHAVSTTNKQAQGHGDVELDAASAMNWLARLEQIYSMVEEHYQLGLSIGMPKELARCSMVVSRFSRMRASTNLRNWLAFMTLRADMGAQWEIRQYAYALARIIEREMPRTYKLFDLRRVAGAP